MNIDPNDNYFFSLIAKKMLGDITSEEHDHLDAFIRKNEEYKQCYCLINDLKLDEQASEEEIKHAFDIVLHKIETGENARPSQEREMPQQKASGKLRKFLYHGYWSRIAAVFILIAGCIYAGYFFLKPAVKQQSYAVQQTLKWITVTNDRENKKLITLNDGTKVYLRKRTTLKYNEDYGLNTREMILNGEAFFDVAKNENAPLIVHAGNVNVKVLGTTFNIQAYEGEPYVSTSLISGKVEVVSNSDPQRVIQLKPKEKLTIKAYKTTIPFNANDSVSQTNMEDKSGYVIEVLEAESTSLLIPEVAWIEQKLVFNKESFEEIADKMEHWYNVKFYFEDEGLRYQIYTGVFEKESLVQALEALKISYPFSYKIEGDKVFIKAK